MSAEYEQSEDQTPMPLYKAIGWLLLLYLIIGGNAVWQLRRVCLIDRDDCGIPELVDTVFSSRLALIGSILIVAVLLQLTWHLISRARAGTLGIEEEPEEPKFNGSGLVVAIVIFALYLAVVFAIVLSAQNSPDILDEISAALYFWKHAGPVIAAPIVFTIVWHLNDYFAKPAPGFVLLALFFAVLGAIYMLIRSNF